MEGHVAKRRINTIASHFVAHEDLSAQQLLPMVRLLLSEYFYHALCVYLRVHHSLTHRILVCTIYKTAHGYINKG